MVEMRQVKRVNYEKAVSPVIATILMVAITVVLSGVLYVWAANLAESNTDGTFEMFTPVDRSGYRLTGCWVEDRQIRTTTDP